LIGGVLVEYYAPSFSAYIAAALGIVCLLIALTIKR